jgi:hypothetical protein
MNELTYKLLFFVCCAVFAKGWHFACDFDFDRPLKKVAFYVFSKNKVVWKAFFGCPVCISGWASFFSYPFVMGYDETWILSPIMGMGMYLTLNRFEQ